MCVGISMVIHLPTLITETLDSYSDCWHLELMELMDSIFLPTLCSIHLHLCASVATKGRESLDSGGLRLTFQVPKMEESSPIKKNGRYGLCKGRVSTPKIGFIRFRKPSIFGTWNPEILGDRWMETTLPKTNSPPPESQVNGWKMTTFFFGAKGLFFIGANLLLVSGRVYASLHQVHGIWTGQLGDEARHCLLHKMYIFVNISCISHLHIRISTKSHTMLSSFIQTMSLCWYHDEFMTFFNVHSGNSSSRCFKGSKS